MASTRNRNTPGDYALEQRAYAQAADRMSFEHSQYYAYAQTTYLPGRGLVGARLPHRLMSANYSDVESSLFGIGASNMESGPAAQVVPEPNRFQHLDIATRPYPFIMPDAFAGQELQRPMWLN